MLNNDCTFDKYFLTRAVEGLEKHKNWGIVGSKMNYMDYPDTIWAAGGKLNKYFGTTKLVMNKEKDEYDNKEEYIDIDYTNGLVKAELYKKIGYFDENYFIYSEETDFCLKAKKAGFEVKCRLDSKFYHKVSLTDEKIKGFSTYYMTRNKIYFLKKNYKFPFIISSFLYLLFISFPMYLIYYPLYYKNFSIVKAYLKGTMDGLSGKMGKTSYFDKNKKKKQI